MAVVEEYWSGVLQRLQAEVDIFNRLIKHAGEKGRENELSLARILASLIPKRYGVGSGLLIDSKDGYSSQTDIVIFNQADDPAVLAQSSQVLFPVENVRACIEVKTSVGSEEISDCGDKVASVKRLYSSSGSTPLYTLVGYDSTVFPGAIARNIRSLDAEKRPDLVCILNQAIFGGWEEFVCYPISQLTQPKKYVIGIAQLHEVDEGGQRIPGKHVAMPERPAENFRYERGGNHFPITMVNKEFYVVEPSRTLLLFCESLLRLLALRECQAAPTLSVYVTPTARELTIL